MKDYGHLLDTDDARRFSARVLDINEWLADRLDRLPRAIGDRAIGDRAGPLPSPPRATSTRTGASTARPRRRGRRTRRRRAVLRCGRRLLGAAAGTRRPDPRPQGRRRSDEPPHRSGAAVVASANPGCSMHLAAVLDIRGPAPGRHRRRRTRGGGAMTREYAAFVERLEAVAADLDELAFDRLREAVADGEVASTGRRQEADAGSPGDREGRRRAASTRRDVDR